MINYRKYCLEDFEQVKSLCDKNNIAFPTDNELLFVAEDDEGKIIGICGLKKVYQVEPLISENALVSNNLFKMVEGVIVQNDIPRVRAITKEENLFRFTKVGFKKIEEDKIILEKKYNGRI